MLPWQVEINTQMAPIQEVHQDITRNRSTISISTDLGKSSLYLLHGIWISIAFRSLTSLATVARILEPREKVTLKALQYTKI